MYFMILRLHCLHYFISFALDTDDFLGVRLFASPLANSHILSRLCSCAVHKEACFRLPHLKSPLTSIPELTMPWVLFNFYFYFFGSSTDRFLTDHMTPYLLSLLFIVCLLAPPHWNINSLRVYRLHFAH